MFLSGREKFRPAVLNECLQFRLMAFSVIHQSAHVGLRRIPDHLATGGDDVAGTGIPVASGELLLNRFGRSVSQGGDRIDIAGQYLPASIVQRRKVGLLLPYDQWLRDPEALGRYLDNLTDSDCQLAAYAEPGALRRTVEHFRSNDNAPLPSLWRLVNVELWLRSLRAPHRAAEVSPQSAGIHAA